MFALPGKTEGAKVVKYDDTSSKDGGKKPHVPRMHLEFKGKAAVVIGNAPYRTE